MDIDQLAQLRRNLVDARHELREATEIEKLAKAEAETRAALDAEQTARVEAEASGTPPPKPGTALGANEKERERALTVAVARDSLYRHAQTVLSNAQWRVEQLTAEIEAAMDERRAEEAVRTMRDVESRDKLSDALMACARIPGTFATPRDVGIAAMAR